MFKAVIFDLDGVIIDSMKPHCEIERDIVKENGVDVPVEEFYQFGGVPVREIFKLYLKNKDVNYNELIKEKGRRIHEALDKGIPPVDHVIDLIKTLHKNNIKLAVASGSGKEFIEKCISQLNLEKYFDYLVSSYEVGHHKPAPDVFLKAAELLNIDPKDCLVIEDGSAGMEGAKAANMKCIALVREFDETLPTKNQIKSLKEIDFKYLENLS